MAVDIDPNRLNLSGGIGRSFEGAPGLFEDKFRSFFFGAAAFETRLQGRDLSLHGVEFFYTRLLLSEIGGDRFDLTGVIGLLGRVGFMLVLDRRGPGKLALGPGDVLAPRGDGHIKKARRFTQFFSRLTIFLDLKQTVKSNLSLGRSFQENSSKCSLRYAYRLAK